MTEQREKAAAEPPLDCRVGHWIETKTNLPEHGEWVLAGYCGVYSPRYVQFWRDGSNNPHFGGPNADSDGALAPVGLECRVGLPA